MRRHRLLPPLRDTLRPLSFRDHDHIWEERVKAERKKAEELRVAAEGERMKSAKWDDVFLYHRLKGMDPSDAAHRADEWEKRNSKRGVTKMFKILVIVVGKTAFTETAWGVSSQVLSYEDNGAAENALQKLNVIEDGHCSVRAWRLY